MVEREPTKIAPDEIPLAWEYLCVGTSYFESAKLLQSQNTNSSQDKIYKPVIYYLASHAAELFLKAALIKRKIYSKKLKGFELRHNIIDLYKLLEKQGKPLSNETKTALGILSFAHKNHFFRYRLSIYIPGSNLSIEGIFNALEELAQAYRLRED